MAYSLGLEEIQKHAHQHFQESYDHLISLVSRDYRFEEIEIIDRPSATTVQSLCVAYFTDTESTKYEQINAVFEDGSVAYCRGVPETAFQEIASPFPRVGSGKIREHVAPFNCLQTTSKALRAEKQAALQTHKLLVKFIYLTKERCETIDSSDEATLLSDFKQLCTTIEKKSQSKDPERKVLSGRTVHKYRQRVPVHNLSDDEADEVPLRSNHCTYCPALVSLSD